MSAQKSCASPCPLLVLHVIPSGSSFQALMPGKCVVFMVQARAPFLLLEFRRWRGLPSIIETCTSSQTCKEQRRKH
eukprot:3053251-Amphidinium_carterae.1